MEIFIFINLCQNESETIIKRQNGKCKQFIVQMVCLSSLNTRVISHCENLQIDDDDVHFNLATDFCVFTFACISTHTKKITEQVIAHTEIFLRTKCAKCSAKK